MATDWIVTYITRHPMLGVESVRDLAVRAKSEADAIAYAEYVVLYRTEDILVGKPAARRFV
jgi:hypothetical protein